MTFILSDDSINSKGYRVLTSGIELDDFVKNPVMLFGHDHKDVIGKWENIRKEGDKLMADPIFDETDKDSLKIKKKVENGFIKSNSIGFKVLEAEMIDDVLTVTKSILMESSIVSVPSNKNAIKLYNSDNEILEEEEQILSVSIKNNPNKMDNKKIMEILSIEKDEQIFDAVKELSEKVNSLTDTVKNDQKIIKTKDDEVKNLNSEVENLNNKLKEIEKNEKTKEISNYLEEAYSSGKINELQKENFEKLSENDFETVKSIVDELKPLEEETLSESIKTDGGNSNDRSEWTLADWDEKDPEGLKEIMENEPKRFDELYQKQKDIEKNM